MLICSFHATVNIPWPYQTKFLCRLCVSPIFFACNAFKGAHKSWIMDINDIRTPSPFIQLHYHLPDDSAYIYTNCVNMFLPFHTVRSSFWRLPLLWLLRVLQQISSLSWWPSTRQKTANLQIKKSKKTSSLRFIN